MAGKAGDFLATKLEAERAKLAAASADAAPGTDTSAIADTASVAADDAPPAQGDVQPPAQSEPVHQDEPQKSDPTAPSKPDYEQQWRTQNGLLKKKDEEINRLREEISQLQTTTNDLFGKVSEFLKQPPAQAEGQKNSPAPEQKPLIAVQALTDEEDSILGGADSELASAVRKLATAEFATVFAELEARIKAIEDALTAKIAEVGTQVETVVKSEAEKREEAFLAKLAGLVPNYEAIHNSGDFVEWTKKNRERITGIAYNEIYAHHLTKTFDAEAIALIMNTYLEAKGLAAPPASSAPATQPSAASEKPGVAGLPDALDDQIAPARSSGAGVPGAGKPEKPLTEADVARLAQKAMSARTPEATKAFEEARDTFYKQQAAVAAQRK